MLKSEAKLGINVKIAGDEKNYFILRNEDSYVGEPGKAEYLTLRQIDDPSNVVEKDASDCTLS